MSECCLWGHAWEWRAYGYDPQISETVYMESADTDLPVHPLLIQYRVGFKAFLWTENSH